MESQEKICVESRLEPKPLYETKTNWIDEYCRNIRKDRVIWDTKLYASSREFSRKSMYEQVEELMDIVSYVIEHLVLIHFIHISNEPNFYI